MTHHVHLADPAATESFGAALARAIGADGAVIALSGPLGAGKTTLVRGCLHALGHPGPVRSPTYTLVEPYEVGGRRVLHLDLYRIAAAEDLESLGLREETVPGAVWLVEWPERGQGHLPAADLTLALSHASDGRAVRLTAHSARGRELAAGVESCD